MEDDNHSNNNGSLNLRPVAAEETGEGLPYAPENWPEPGDVWKWKTGRRVNSQGNFQDRYLYMPLRLNRDEKPSSSNRKHGRIFSSKLSLERYIKTNFPGADVDAFFASFSWRIPALPSAFANGNVVPIAAVPLQQIAVAEESDHDCGDEIVKCNAGNKKCDSLILEEVEKYSPAMPCDICCSEPGFCRDCCCILCCKTVSSAYGGYNYIKCKVMAGEGICGHVAHMECALRARMAGTVEISIGLDAEYYCRRCDGRTNLIPHVNNLLQTCQAGDLDDEIQNKILHLGACLLRGSRNPLAKELLSHIELAISKLKGGTVLEDSLKVDDNITAQPAGLSNHDDDVMEVTANGRPLDARIGRESDDYLKHSVKLETEVDEVLLDLRKSQELEYKVAEERLQEQKTYLRNLYQQLRTEKAELACQNSNSTGSDALSRAVRERKEQIRREVKKFKVMKKVANGFGKTPKKVLMEYFGLEIAK